MKILIATTCTPDDRKTLAIVRSLGRAGHEVVVGGDDFQGQAFYSKYVGRLVRYPHPASDPEGFLDALRRLLEREKFDALLPANDYTTVALAEVKSAWRSLVAMPVPDPGPLAITRDKFETGRLAREFGIRTPLTFSPSDEDELRQAAQRLSYPCVFKLSKGAGAVGLRFVESWDHLLRCYRDRSGRSDMIFDRDRPLVQEFVPGEVHSLVALFCRGEPRAAMTQKRLRMYPARGGVGIYNETTAEPHLRELGLALLKALEWHGPAMVEFLIRSDTGEAYLIEVNGRYWGTLDLAIRAGIDVPLMAARMAAEGDIEPVSNYQVGLRYRWPIPFGVLHARDSGQ